MSLAKMKATTLRITTSSGLFYLVPLVAGACEVGRMPVSLDV